MSGPFGSGSGHLGDVLSALLDGELLPTQEDQARAHLAVCPDCTGELAAVEQARAWVRALPTVEPPFGFYERMLLDHPARPTANTAFRPGNAGVGAGNRPFGTGRAAFAPRPAGTFRRRAGAAAFGAAAVAVTVLNAGSPSPRPAISSVSTRVEARTAGASASADLLSKLTPVGIPVSYGRR